MLMARYTEQDILRSIRTVASLIDRFGDAYWPILERLEQELESRRSRAARLQRYLQTGRFLEDVHPRADAQMSTPPERSSYVRAKDADMHRRV